MICFINSRIDHCAASLGPRIAQIWSTAGKLHLLRGCCLSTPTYTADNAIVPEKQTWLGSGDAGIRAPGRRLSAGLMPGRRHRRRPGIGPALGRRPGARSGRWRARDSRDVGTYPADGPGRHGGFPSPCPACGTANGVDVSAGRSAHSTYWGFLFYITPL